MKYILEFLAGTSKFVKEELLLKYPNTQISGENQTSLTFLTEGSDLETFRNLYSPSHIKDSNGKELNLSKRPWRKEYVPAGINPSLAYIMCQIANMIQYDSL
jgi:hypothetical protein